MMKSNYNLLSYKGFIGSVNYSPEDRVLFGKIEGIQGLMSYEGTSVGELEEAFKEAVEEYINICTEQGKDPYKSFSGSFNVRIPVELHQQAYLMAKSQKITLNKLVKNAIESKISSLQSIQ